MLALKPFKSFVFFTTQIRPVLGVFGTNLFYFPGEASATDVTGHHVVPSTLIEV